MAKKEKVKKEEIVEEEKELFIFVKKGGVSVKAKRSDVVEVEPTHDGIVITFKGGLQLYNTEIYMTSPIKNLIKNTVDTYKSGNIEIDLDNPQKPVSVVL